MKKSHIYIIISILILAIGVTFGIYSKSNNKEVLKIEDKKNTINNSMFAIMLETGVDTGKYDPSPTNTWPGNGYTFNAEMSKCENGSKLSWNAEKNKVTLKANVSDKCYVYFDAPKISDVKVETSNIPTTVGALPNLNCTGSTSTYNEKYNRIEISQINNKITSCTLSFTDRTTKTYLNDKVKGLADTTASQTDWKVVNENGYRYEGKDPNNYIWFNNELWRIIGVFDTDTHAQTDVSSTEAVKENLLVKIIRERPIGGLAWDKSNTNNWSASSLYKLLNPIEGDRDSGAYYNASNGTGGLYCYGDDDMPANCDYTQIGIQDNYRGMIKNVTWHLGGYDSVVTAEAFYGYERGKIKYGSNPTETSGYVGLMYPSDYGYSVIASTDCPRSKSLSEYDIAACGGQSWLYGEGGEWTLTPLSNSKNVFNVSSGGYLKSSYPYYGYSARPSLYLDASVFVYDGDGSRLDPYIIGM